MKTSTLRIILAFCLLLVLVLSSVAQVPPTVGMFSTAPGASTTITNITAANTNNYSAGSTNYIDCRGAKYVTLQAQVRGIAAGSTAITFVLQPTTTGWYDGKVQTILANATRWSFVPNGTTEQIATTNILVAGCSGFYVTSWENPNGSGCGFTNTVLRYGLGY